MTSRGMTLLEVVVSLALLAGVTTACVSWTSATTRALAIYGGEMSWRRSAARTFELIDEWLAVGDAPRTRTRSAEWRLAPRPESLAIRTREVARSTDQRGRLCDEVRLVLEGGDLTAEYLSRGQPVRSRPLLGRVASMHCETVVLRGGMREVEMVLVGACGVREGRTWRLTSSEVAP